MPLLVRVALRGSPPIRPIAATSSYYFEGVTSLCHEPGSLPWHTQSTPFWQTRASPTRISTWRGDDEPMALLDSIGLVRRPHHTSMRKAL